MKLYNKQMPRRRTSTRSHHAKVGAGFFDTIKSIVSNPTVQDLAKKGISMGVDYGLKSLLGGSRRRVSGRGHPPKGSTEAREKMARVRSHIGNRGVLVRGSPEAEAHMAKLRAIKAHKAQARHSLLGGRLRRGGSFVPAGF